AAEQMSGREIVTTALSLLRANYVFPEPAEQAATAVEARLAAGEYDHLDEITLTERLTRHLREICEDKHLAVRLGGGPPEPPPGRGPEPERREPEDHDDHDARRLAMRRRGRLDNFGIRRVERLDGNVGYLDVRRVAVPANAGPAIAAAMELMAGTYALIIDLRCCLSPACFPPSAGKKQPWRRTGPPEARSSRRLLPHLLAVGVDGTAGRD